MASPEIIYKMKAPPVKGATVTAIIVALTLILCAFLLRVCTFLPLSWLFEIAIILLCAAYINHTLKQGTFETTYILYEDSLDIVTKYGFIEKVTAHFDRNNTRFTKTHIISGGKTYPFYPDKKLKSLLNI